MRTHPRTSASLLQLLGNITDRDRQICRDLFDHKVLTTHQLFELHFDAPRRARKRLLSLYGWGLLDRFQPNGRVGSRPFHYLLGELGLELVAADRGVETKEIRPRRDRIRRLAQSRSLDHLIEVNGFFAHLAYACRHRGDIRLTQWWSESRCAREWGNLVHPDGVGVVRSEVAEVRFFLEVDRGTEPTTRLAEKLVVYGRISRFEGAPGLLLFTFPSARREAEARKALYGGGLLVATTNRDLLFDAALGAVWLPADASRRIRLEDFASPWKDSSQEPL